MCRRPGSLLVIAMVVGAFSIGPHGAPLADILIGVGGPLTGPYARTGNSNRIAAEMAVRDLNETGGVLGEEVRLVAADDGCGFEQSLDAARELVNAGVQFVSGHLCSHSSLLAAGFYETADILMITPASTHPRITEEGRKNVFRLVGRDDRQGRLAGDLLASRWPGERIAILHDGSTYGEGLAAATRKRLHAWKETEAVYGFYAPGQEDFQTLASELQEQQIEALFVGGYGPDAGRIARAARQIGFELQIVGGDGLGMAEFWEVAGEDGEGTIFSGRPEIDTDAETGAGPDRFRIPFPGETSDGIGTYATIQVWAQAVEHVGSLDFRALVHTLHHGRFDTVLGRVAFDDKGDLRNAHWQWKIWSEGTYEPMTSRMATQ